MAKIALISPMWPSREDPHMGIFVQNSVQALEKQGFSFQCATVPGLRRTPTEKLKAHSRLALEISRLGTYQPELIYLHAPSWFAGLAYLLSRLPKVPLVLHFHGDELFPHSLVERLSKPLVRLVSQRANRIVCPSRYYAQEVEKGFGISPKKIVVSPSGGVCPKTFYPGDQLAARRALGLPKDSFILGYAGRLIPQKGLELLLPTVGKLREQGLAAQALVVGEGPLTNYLQTTAESLGLQEHLYLYPPVPQPKLRSYYVACDQLLFLPSRPAESLGLTPLEAMASGTPVIGRRFAALPEYLEAGKGGLFSPSLSAKAIAQAAEQLRALKLAPEEISDSVSIYESQLVAQKLADLFRKCLAEKLP